MSLTKRYLIYLSYIGTNFRGSQIQISPNLNEYIQTVQGSVENALKSLLKLEGNRPIGTLISSRTDAGVHALRAAVHADLPPLRSQKFIEPCSLQSRLNKYFNKHNLDIRVPEVCRVPDTFSARHSSYEKVYMYRIGILKEDFKNCHSSIPLSEYKRCYLSVQKFDLNKANEVASLFKGERDFIALAGRPKQITCSTICNIYSFTVEEARPFLPDFDPFTEYYNYYHLVCKGNRFLYRMVRRMVSVVLAACAGHITLDDVRLMLDKPDPSSWNSKINVVPPYGLYMANVKFNPEHLILQEEDMENKVNEAYSVESEVSSNKII